MLAKCYDKRMPSFEDDERLERGEHDPERRRPYDLAISEQVANDVKSALYEIVTRICHEKGKEIDQLAEFKGEPDTMSVVCFPQGNFTDHAILASISLRLQRECRIESNDVRRTECKTVTIYPEYVWKALERISDSNRVTVAALLCAPLLKHQKIRHTDAIMVRDAMQNYKIPSSFSTPQPLVDDAKERNEKTKMGFAALLDRWKKFAGESILRGIHPVNVDLLRVHQDKDALSYDLDITGSHGITLSETHLCWSNNHCVSPAGPESWQYTGWLVNGLPKVHRIQLADYLQRKYAETTSGDAYEAATDDAAFEHVKMNDLLDRIREGSLSES